MIGSFATGDSTGSATIGKSVLTVSRLDAAARSTSYTVSSGDIGISTGGISETSMGPQHAPAAFTDSINSPNAECVRTFGFSIFVASDVASISGHFTRLL